MPEGIDQKSLERACVLLAEHHNEGLPEELQQYTAEGFRSYEVVPYDEWLIFSSPGGFTNQIFLVSDPMVYAMEGWEPYDEAIPEARKLKAAGATRRPPEPDDEDDE